MNIEIPENFNELPLQEKINLFVDIVPRKGYEFDVKFVFKYKITTETWFFRRDSWVGPKGQIVKMKEHAGVIE